MLNLKAESVQTDYLYCYWVDLRTRMSALNLSQMTEPTKMKMVQMSMVVVDQYFP